MLRLVLGPRGGGKTYFVVRDMLMRAVKSDKIICTNLAVTEKMRRLLAGRLVLLDFEKLKTFWEHCPAGSLVYLDELHLAFDCRNYSKIPLAFVEYLAHLRHYKGEELTVISQRMDFVDKRVRALADQFYWCESTRRVGHSFGFGGWVPEMFMVRLFPDETLSSAMKTWMLRCQPGVYNYYDSWAVAAAEVVHRASASNVVFDDVGGVAVEESRSSRWRYFGPLAASVVGGVCGALS